METKNKGITLIALIITIIVLLILAGVTIATLTGNHGILTQVDNAKVSTIEATVKEEIGLAVQSANLKIRTKTAQDNSWNATTDENIGIIVDILEDDLKEGYTVRPEELDTETGIRKISVVYAGSDYKKAKKDNNAQITKTLDVSSNKIIYGDCDHDWEDGEVITEASCSAAGSKKQTCTKCGETRTEEIPALVHNFVDGVCTVCGERDNLVIGAKIDYKEYISPISGLKFEEMPTYTTQKLRSSDNKTYTVKEPTAEETGIEWIVLGRENGQIKITTKDCVLPTSGTTLGLYGKAGYENFVNELNAIGAIYGQGKYADTSKFQGETTGGRSFIMEDLGYNKLTKTAVYTYARHDNGKIYRYAAGTTEFGGSTTGGNYDTFEYMEQDASTSTAEGAYTWKTLSAENPSVTMYQYNYTGSQTLSTDIAKTASGDYCLASRCLGPSSGLVNFKVCMVTTYGVDSSCSLYDSTGHGYYQPFGGVRPVVYLKSDIQLSDYDSANNAYTIVEPGT